MMLRHGEVLVSRLKHRRVPMRGIHRAQSRTQQRVRAEAMTQLQAFSQLVEITPRSSVPQVGGLHMLPPVGMSQSTQGDLQSSRQA